VTRIRAGRRITDKQARRAVTATVRYVLRAQGRPTPFGLFAGVAPVRLDHHTDVDCGTLHTPVTRPDTQWLADVVDQLESCPALLDRLDVAANNLARRRGGRLELATGTGRTSIGATPAGEAAIDAATSLIRCTTLVDKLAETFTASRPAAAAMVAGLVRHGFLLTELRAPHTVTTPLKYLLDRLADADAATIGEVAPLLDHLHDVAAQLAHLNNIAADQVVVPAVAHARRHERMPFRFALQ
jgi:hypothetical protein